MECKIANRGRAQGLFSGVNDGNFFEVSLNYIQTRPTLVEIKKVEEIIRKEDLTFNQLNKKINGEIEVEAIRIILDYFFETKKIIYEDDGTISYIYNPVLAEQLKKNE